MNAGFKDRKFMMPPIKTFPEFISILFRIQVFQKDLNYSATEEKNHFQKKKQNVGGTHISRKKTKCRLVGKYIYTKFFVGEIFPSYNMHMDQRMTHLRCLCFIVVEQNSSTLLNVSFASY